MIDKVRYIAFLRGINVSGKNVIKMADLKLIFEKSGFQEVRTYIQSGNVLCSSSKNLFNEIVLKIQNELKTYFDETIPVFYFTLGKLEEIRQWVDNFSTSQNTKKKLYITFTDCIPDNLLKFPVEFIKDGVILHSFFKNIVLSESLPVKNGYGFPNKIIEKFLKCNSTTRNLHILNKILGLPK